MSKKLLEVGKYYKVIHDRPYDTKVIKYLYCAEHFYGEFVKAIVVMEVIYEGEQAEKKYVAFLTNDTIHIASGDFEEITRVQFLEHLRDKQVQIMNDFLKRTLNDGAKVIAETMKLYKKELERVH